MKGFLKWCLIGALAISSPAFARDVAFVEPGNSGGNAVVEEAFKIEPKSEIDIGDSIINIVRRQTLFFVNQTSAPIKIEKVTLSSDSTVSSIIVNDDCSKQDTIAPLSRCSIELSVTPTGPGGWGTELLMTHNGPGRITRAKITGKTAGSDAGDKKDRGLFLSTKETKPIDFGEVTVGEGTKIVRSALMVNDSPSPITLYSIDVIEADKNLQRLDQGCAPDMDLKPGESCPVTMVWTPTGHSIISTDLIIRHSGQLGFAVVPIRGVAKGDAVAADQGSRAATSGSNKNDIPPPLPPSAADVAKELSKVALNPAGADSLSAATGALHLIGTVGNRAVLLKPDGTTVIVQAGDPVDLGGSSAKVDSVGATKAVLLIDGKKKEFALEAVQELKDKAIASKKSASASNISGKDGSKDNASGTSLGLGLAGGGGGQQGSGGGLGFGAPR